MGASALQASWPTGAAAQDGQVRRVSKKQRAKQKQRARARARKRAAAQKARPAESNKPEEKPAPPAPSAGEGTQTAEADADSEIVREGQREVKVMNFSGLDVEGRLKSPQLLYFVHRVRAEFDRPRLPHRSFLPELSRSAHGEQLR
jgi:hypothetical protein